MLHFWTVANQNIPETQKREELLMVGMYLGQDTDERWWEAEHVAQQNLSSISKDMYT